MYGVFSRISLVSSLIMTWRLASSRSRYMSATFLSKAGSEYCDGFHTSLVTKLLRIVVVGLVWPLFMK